MKSATSTTPFLVINMVVGILGFVLAVSSLVWQTVSWKLSGGRPKVVAKLGAMHQSGQGMVTFDSTASEESMARTIEQGYSQPVIAVEVKNAGRLQMTVTAWKVVAPGGSFRPLRFVTGPELPHTLAAGGAPETWATDADEVREMVLTLREVLGRSGDIYVEVEFGDGSKIGTPLNVAF